MAFEERPFSPKASTRGRRWTCVCLPQRTDAGEANGANEGTTEMAVQSFRSRVQHQVSSTSYAFVGTNRRIETIVRCTYPCLVLHTRTSCVPSHGLPDAHSLHPRPVLDFRVHDDDTILGMIPNDQPVLTSHLVDM